MTRTKPIASTSISTTRWLLAGALLLTALLASGLLVLHHFDSISMPGCRVKSACDLAAKSVYGKVGAFPVSWLGFCHFLALSIVWFACRGAIGGFWKLVALLGAVASLFYSTIAIIHGFLCPYCFAAHGANLVFVALAGSFKPTRSTRNATIAALVTGVTVLGAMIVIDLRNKARASDESDQELAKTIEQLNSPQSQAAPNTTPNPELAVQPENPLIGRYVIGPESAPVRIVTWLGYQCSDCQRIENELQSLIRANPGKINVTFRHFPLNTDCNPNAPGRHHGNGCWAARAAECAGMLGGASSFEIMHEWLFSIKGDFSNAQLRTQTTSMGFDPVAFDRLMNDPTSLIPVKADIDDAMTLGIFQTPFIFINGVELRGWNAPQALTRAVQSVLSANPQSIKAGADIAPTAADKFVADWRAMPNLNPPADLTRLYQGQADADVEVIVWGDYMEPGTAEVDGMFRLFTTTQKPNVKYTFLQFPVNQSCNSSIKLTKFPNTCRSARAAKAAEILAGPDGFRKMHDRLFLNKGDLSDAMIEGVALELGLNPSDLWEAMNLPDTQSMIDREAAAAMPLGLTSIPFVLVNGKQLTRFKAEHENIIPRIINAAAEDRAASNVK